MIQNSFKYLYKVLRKKTIVNATLESGLILANILKVKREELFILKDKDFCYSEIFKLNTILNKRIKGIPLEYLLYNKGFYNLEFYVNKDVLIPRPETELIIEYIKNDIYTSKVKDKIFKILDLGVGSGNVSLSILDTLNYMNIKYYIKSIDIDRKAIYVTLKNFIFNFLDYYFKYKKNKSIFEIKRSNLFSKLGKTEDQFDYIISNPPYLTKDEIKNGLEYEPFKALYGKSRSGFYFYKKIAEYSSKFMKKTSQIILEVPKYKYKKIIPIFEKRGFTLKVFIKDLSGVHRVLVFKLKI